MSKNKTSQLSPVWAQHISKPDEKLAFERSVKASRLVLGRLKEIVHQRLRESRPKKLRAYAEAGWSLAMADYLGKVELAELLFQLLPEEGELTDAHLFINEEN